ncbi:MAG: hypothetical protein ACHQT9_03965 [Candidatus Saccharimonadales bacterium]
MSFGVYRQNRPPSSFPVPIPFKDAGHATHDEKIRAGTAEKDAIAKFREHIIDISGDHEGSDPEAYLSPTDYTTLMNFVDLADHIGWAGAQTIGLKTHRTYSTLIEPSGEEKPVGLKAWSASPRQPARNGLMQAIMLRRAGEEHKAFVFGKLSVADPDQLVAIADDGNLYSQREMDGTQQSYGQGWGRLPNPEIIEPVMATGQHYGVDANAFRKPMLKWLIELVPKSALEHVDLEDFDLGDYNKLHMS